MRTPWLYGVYREAGGRCRQATDSPHSWKGHSEPLLRTGGSDVTSHIWGEGRSVSGLFRVSGGLLGGRWVSNRRSLPCADIVFLWVLDLQNIMRFWSLSVLRFAVHWSPTSSLSFFGLVSGQAGEMESCFKDLFLFLIVCLYVCICL